MKIKKLLEDSQNRKKVICSQCLTSTNESNLTETFENKQEENNEKLNILKRKPDETINLSAKKLKLNKNTPFKNSEELFESSTNYKKNISNKILAPETQINIKSKFQNTPKKCIIPETVSFETYYENSDFFDSYSNDKNKNSTDKKYSDSDNKSEKITTQLSSPINKKENLISSSMTSPVLGKQKNSRIPLNSVVSKLNFETSPNSINKSDAKDIKEIKDCKLKNDCFDDDLVIDISSSNSGDKSRKHISPESIFCKPSNTESSKTNFRRSIRIIRF